MQTGQPQNDRGTPERAPLAFLPHPTPWLREFVTAQAQTLPAEEYTRLLATLRELHTRYLVVLQEAAPGTARAEALHRMLDRALATAHDQPLSCRRGCAGCCHFEVEITPDEAALLAVKVRAGAAIDRERLRLQSARPRLDPAWSRFFAPENRCVFLGDDDACRIYESRPAACRRLLVTTPAEACTTPGAAVAPVPVLIAEVLLSAALEMASGTQASLASLLRRELDRRSAA